MSAYSSLVKHVTYPLFDLKDGRRGTYGHLKSLERSQWLPPAAIAELQTVRLSRLLHHAYYNTLYYREVMDQYSFRPQDFRDLADLRRLPVLTKRVIRERLPEMRAMNIPIEHTHTSETGGTTGVKLRFCRDNSCLAPKAAATIRHERWTGWDIGMPRGVIWPAAQDYVGHHTWRSRLRNALTERASTLPAAVLNEERIRAYILDHRRRRPAMLRGFATSLYLVSYNILRMGEHLPPVRGIVSTGEPLYPHQRRVIERAFGGPVFDTYSSRELALVAQECSEHNGMHISSESIYLEVDETSPSGRSRLLGTDLLNYGMPLIRYDLGDTGVLTRRECLCGRGLPLLEMGVGREADVMFSPAGDVIAAVTLVLYLVDNGPMVGQVQVVQDAIDHLEVRITRDPEPTKDVFAHYRREIARLFGNDMRVTFALVDSIGAEPSGKYRFAVCSIPETAKPIAYQNISHVAKTSEDHTASE